MKEKEDKVFEIYNLRGVFEIQRTDTGDVMIYIVHIIKLNLGKCGQVMLSSKLEQ